VDGSHVVGATSIESVPVETAYARINIPLRHILTIKTGDDHETAVIDLRNGDRLKGVLNLEPVILTTIFGQVSIDIELVKQLDVVRSDGPPRHGLVLHFDFNGDARDRVPDASQKGNDGQPVGTAWGRDERRGGILQFDGQKALINAGHGPDMDITQNLSISVWIRKRLKDFGDPLQALVGKDDGPDWPGRSYMLFLRDLPGEKCLGFSYGVKVGGHNGRHDLIAQGVNLAYDQWHHVAVVHETGAGNRMYVDGKCVGEDEEGSPLPFNPDTDTILGKTQASEPWLFFGAMDDVMIYNRALCASEIKQIYDAQK